MDFPTFTPQNVSLPADFNPYVQNVTLLMPYGPDASVLVTFTLSFLNNWKNEVLKICVVFGSQIGASLIMLMMVAITTRKAKRSQPIFWLNMTSLLLAFIRALLFALFYIGPFQHVYRYISTDYSAVPRHAYNLSVTGTISTLLLLCTIEASLVLQTNVVCLTMAPKWRRVVVCFSIIVILLACITRIILSAINIQAILETTYNEKTEMYAKLALASETASIWYFCAVFLGKLAWTMYIRQRMGLKQWGPMQIICITSGCTLVIPSVFAILEWFPSQTFPESRSLTLTVVAIFLPLSSVWASMSATDERSPARMSEPRLNFASNDSHSGNRSTTGMQSAMDSKRGLMASFQDRKGSRCSGKSGNGTFGTTSTAVEYADSHGGDHDLEAQKHSNAFFGINKFGQRGQSTATARKGSDVNTGGDDIEMQDGVRIERVFEVQRGAPGVADGGEGTGQQGKIKKVHHNA